MESILGGTWYTCADAARALEVSEEVMQRFFDMMLADKRTPRALYQGPEAPMLSGYSLQKFARPQQAQQEQPKPTISKRRHAR